MACDRIDLADDLWHEGGSMPGFIFICCALFLFLMLGLRYSKSVMPLRTLEDRTLPGLPGPKGLVRRLDGMERGRMLLPGTTPEVIDEGNLILPAHWEHDVTVGRYACIAYTWALGRMAEEDPEGEQQRKKTLARARVIPVFTFLIALVLVFMHHISTATGLSLFLFVWAFLIFAGLTSQGRDRKAVDLAKTGLKQAGLWPQLHQDAMAIEGCLDAMAWSQIPGLKRVLPR